MGANRGRKPRERSCQLEQVEQAVSRLRAARRRQGVSLRQLEARGVATRGHLSKVERGEVRPSVGLLLALARELELPELEGVLRLYAVVPSPEPVGAA
jgi:transcriptional regulator with XRE-family HTH domain